MSEPRENPDQSKLSRRGFLGRAGGIATAAVAATAIGSAADEARADDSCRLEPQNYRDRAGSAFKARVAAARQQRQTPPAVQHCNGDEGLYSNYIGQYSKGLLHNAIGEVDAASYESLLAAVASGDPAAYNAIIVGCPGQRKQVNPQGAMCYSLDGADSHRLACPAAPALASAEAAGELVENYWHALLRDVPFADYGTDVDAAAAAADLTAMSDFRGPKDGGSVTPDTLFRGTFPGDEVGPYLSQFLYLNNPFGANLVEQRIRPPAAGVNFMTSPTEWLNVQNGCNPTGVLSLGTTRRYITNGRELGEWLRLDFSYQGFLQAALILGSLGTPLNVGNPYIGNPTQGGFVTFGGPHLLTLVAQAGLEALKAAWYQKWHVHRRVRPEAMAGLVHHHILGDASYPLHSDLLNSAGLAAVQSLTGNSLLPMGYPEGSPLHPSYAAGHPCISGACTTILKAWFNENFVIAAPMVPNPADPTTLMPYVGDPLTVGGELNKLASNISIGRNHAGVHYRSDAAASLELGEQVAIELLRDLTHTYHESFAGFTFTKFDGTLITI